MNEDIKLYLAYLLQREGVGSKKIINIYNQLNEPKLFNCSLNNVNFDVPENFKCSLNKQNIKIITWLDKDYPEQLKNIHDFPALLFCRGNTELLKQNLITIIGSRDISAYGQTVINNIFNRNCIDNVKSNVYVSGLARGVDGAIHKVAIKNNIGTIAVVAGGVDKGYPDVNKSLYDNMCTIRNGLVIAEFPPGRKVIKGMFPMRNRILAALSKNIIVVEAGVNSGAMNTVNYGLEYNKNIYTFPGRIFDEKSRGCNELLRQGAELILGVEDFAKLTN